MTKRLKPEFKVNFSIEEQNRRVTDYNLEPVFRLPNSDQIVIPHHIEPHKWVGLGAVTYTTDELLNSRPRASMPVVKALDRKDYFSRQKSFV